MVKAVAGTFESTKQVIILQLGQVVRRSAGRPRVDLHVLLFQGPGQVLGLVGVAVDQQHARLAGNRDQPEVAVIVEQRVLVALEPRRERGQPPSSIVCLRTTRFSPFLSLTAWSATLMSPR